MSDNFEEVPDADAVTAMADKIFTSNFDDPRTGQGTTRDQIHISENVHFARAALRGLKEAGFVICRKRVS